MYGKLLTKENQKQLKNGRGFFSNIKSHDLENMDKFLSTTNAHFQLNGI